MELAKKPIDDLLSDLDFALMARNTEPGFSYLDFYDDPVEYHPVTARELEIWEELTHPRRHNELVQYPSVFEARSGWPFSRLSRYHRHMYQSTLKASTERLRAENIRESPESSTASPDRA